MISALFFQLNMEILICDTRSFHHLRLSQVCSFLFFGRFENFNDFFLYPSNISLFPATPLPFRVYIIHFYTPVLTAVGDVRNIWRQGLGVIS